VAQGGPSGGLGELLSKLSGSGQALARLGVIAFSTAALVNGLSKDDRVQIGLAIAGYVGSGVSFVWEKVGSRYAKGLTEGLGEEAEKTGKEHAVNAAQAVRSRLAALGYSTFEVKYLEKQVARCSYDDIEGRSRAFVPLLEDVYVPLSLEAGANSRLA